MTESNSPLGRFLTPARVRWMVWCLRLIVGVTFIISGLAKAIDIWGFSFKIGEYLTAWGFDLPNALSVIGALALSVAEFLLGAMLAMGCYKRSSAILLFVMMCGMLPLSLYIFVVNPVADCGCFGDFWVISNGATFAKNIFLTAALIFLILYNRSVPGLYRPNWQWIVGVACAVYVIFISLWGYNIQPVADFRSFPVGSSLVNGSDVEDGASEVSDMAFVYERIGQRATFFADSLPDSTWTFVERIIPEGEGSGTDNATELVVRDHGVDVTEDVIDGSGLQLIVVIPDFRRAGISNTYSLNELYHVIDSIGGSMIEIAAISDSQLEYWSDMSMADYPIYQAESTVLKELSRGVISAVLLSNGKIVWKRTVSSIDVGSIIDAPDKEAALLALAIDGRQVLTRCSMILVAVLVIIFIMQFAMSVVGRWRYSHKIKAGKGENPTEKHDKLQKKQ